MRKPITTFLYKTMLLLVGYSWWLCGLMVTGWPPAAFGQELPGAVSAGPQSRSDDPAGVPHPRPGPPLEGEGGFAPRVAPERLSFRRAEPGAAAGQQSGAWVPSGPSSDWPWRRTDAAEYAGIAAGVAGTLFSEIVYGKPAKPGWTARNGFDQGFRDALRIRGTAGRKAADNFADVMMGLLIAEPVLDSFATLGYRDRRWDALLQTSAINLESFTFTSLVASVLENSLRRQRPFLQTCPNGSCDDDESNRSMPSGHTAFAFTGAGLFCTHHAYQSLYADHDAERAICATSLALAAADGVARILADEHFATDVIAGSALGLFSGFLLPRLLHYWWPAEAAEGHRDAGKEGALLKASNFKLQLLDGGAGLNYDVNF